MSTVSMKVRVATAASAIAAAATLMPAVASATPAAPLPQAAIGSTLGGDTVAPCAPQDTLCAAELAAPGSSSSIIQNPLIWFGPANPNYVPLFGIVFPNIFGLDFEGCILGAGTHLDPYGSGFVGLSLGC